MLTVRQQVDVMRISAHRNFLYNRQALSVHNLHPGFLSDAYIDISSVASNREIVGPATERHLSDSVQGGSIDHIQDILTFARHIKSSLVRRENDGVGILGH